MTVFRTSAQATKTAQVDRSNGLSRPITAQRTNKLIRPLREILDQVKKDDPTVEPPQQYGYGMVEMETRRVFRQITDDGKLHQVHLISGDEIDGVNTYVIEAKSTGVIFPGTYREDRSPGGFPGNITDLETEFARGTVRNGRFSGTGVKGNLPPNGTQIRLFDGRQQAADPDLVAQTAVDDQFVGRGLSYVWSRFAFQDGRFDGDPELKVYCRSRRVLDPRAFLNSFDDSPKTFSINPYRFIFDYLLRPTSRGGAGLDPSLVDVDSFKASTAWSEVLVSTQPTTRTALLSTRTSQNLENGGTGTPPINTNHLLEFQEAICPFQYGDVVNVTAALGQELPINLTPNTDYFVVPIRPRISSFQVPAIALAESLENALDGITIPQGERTTEITVTKVKELRFQAGLVYRSGEQILERMLESCGARLFLNNGRIAITQASFPDAGGINAVGLDELIGPIALSTSINASERATAMSGSFVGLTNLFIPRQYPTVSGDGVFAAADGESRVVGFDLPFVPKASIAQRLATVELRRRRQELSVAFSGDLSLMRLRPNSVFSVDFPRYGLDSNTTFEVREQTLFLRVSNDVPFLGINIEGRQLEAGTFDLNVSNEQFTEDAKILGLDSPFEVAAPSSVTVTEEQFQTREGAGVRSRARISWTPSSSLFVTEYEIFLRRTGVEEDFFFLTRVPATDLQTRIDDLQPDFYDFKVSSINSLGQRSTDDAPQVSNFQIQGLSAVPQAPTNFSGQVLGAATVLLRWDLSPDLDVREGGAVEVRHNPQITGSVDKDAVFLDGDVGAQVSLIVPFKQGTYTLRFKDSTGQFSDAVQWSTQSRRPIGIAQLSAGAGNPLSTSNTDPAAFTIQEDSTFPSSNPGNTLVFDTDHLELPTENTFDDEADVDLIANIDEVGGGNVVSEGVYFFSTDIEIDTPTRILVEAVLSTEVFDDSVSIDAEANFDQIPDVDQVGGTLLTPGLATAEIQVRVSNGTVASDTFGPWETVDTQYFEAKSYQFRVIAKSTVPSVNIRINEARIRMRAVSL